MSEEQKNEVIEIEQSYVPSNRAMVAMKEIEAKITVALKFPRDMTKVEQNIKSMCTRPRFADGSTYSLPRGGKNVNGPSVHFAKGIAQLWKNLDHGSVIEERCSDFTKGFAFAWDLENNINIKKDFYVKHERKAQNRIKIVTDPAEISELVNAQISRAVRNCILEIIPWYIIEEAQELCQKTLRDEQRKTPIEKRRELAKEIFRPYGVDDEKIKKKMGKIFSELNDEELFEIGKAFNSIRDKFLTVARWLGEDTAEDQSPLADKIKEAQAARDNPNTEAKENNNQEA